MRFGYFDISDRNVGSGPRLRPLDDFVIIYFKYIFCSDVVYFQLDGVGGGGLVFVMTGQIESRREEKDSRGKTYSEWPCNSLAAHGSPAQPGELHQHHYFLIINGE